MIVQCEHCKTKFRLADERISSAGVKVRCSKCAHVFTVTRSAVDGRIEARLVDSTASTRPLSPHEIREPLADDLLLPGGFGASPPLGGSPPQGAAFNPLPAWPTPPSPPASFGGSLPPLPFDVGPPPRMSGAPATRPSIPAGRPPPGQHLPSVPLALLDADPSSSGPYIDIDPSADPSGVFEARTDIATRAPRAPTEVDPPRGSPMGRASTQVDPLRSPPQARAPTEVAPKSAAAPIKSPTFPPPPVFDPLAGGLPLQSIAPPPPPPPPPKIPPASSDNFALPRPGDALDALGPSDAFGGAMVGGSAAQLGDLDLGLDDREGSPLARIELRKGLLGQAGVSSFGAANDMTTRIAAKVAKRDGDVTPAADVSGPLARLRRTATVVRSAALLGGLFVLAGIAVLVYGASRQTYVGQPSLLESVLGSRPGLVEGAIVSAYVERARVTAYPLRDPRPRLVVSGSAGNAGAPVTGEVEVVASVLDGDRVVVQQQAPLGALMPLDTLAHARTSEDLAQAWAQVERPREPWATGEVRPFMVVFSELPAGVHGYRVRVDFRPAKPAPGSM